jgi:hypothetical protein
VSGSFGKELSPLAPQSGILDYRTEASYWGIASFPVSGKIPYPWVSEPIGAWCLTQPQGRKMVLAPPLLPPHWIVGWGEVVGERSQSSKDQNALCHVSFSPDACAFFSGNQASFIPPPGTSCLQMPREVVSLLTLSFLCWRHSTTCSGKE